LIYNIEFYITFEISGTNDFTVTHRMSRSVACASSIIFLKSFDRWLNSRMLICVFPYASNSSCTFFRTWKWRNKSRLVDIFISSTNAIKPAFFLLAPNINNWIWKWQHYCFGSTKNVTLSKCVYHLKIWKACLFMIIMCEETDLCLYLLPWEYEKDKSRINQGS